MHPLIELCAKAIEEECRAQGIYRGVADCLVAALRAIPQEQINKVLGEAPCCQDFEHCHKPCTPRGRYLADRDKATPPEVEWLHKFINCVPFGEHCPAEDMTRAHEIVNALADPVARQDKAGEAVATLHDDGHWTWKKGTPSYKSNFAGWRMEVYAAPAALPEGYEIVPKEPTAKMLAAAVNINPEKYGDDPTWPIADQYKAMLAAAQGEMK